MRSPGRVFWPLAVALVLADCSSKRAVEEAIALPGLSRPVVDDVLRFTLAYNRGVVDFIDVGVGAARFYLFNVADAGVSVGAALLLYALWRHDRRAERRAA